MLDSKEDSKYVNRTKTEGPKTESPVSQADSNTKHFRVQNPKNKHLKIQNKIPAQK